MIKSNPFAYRAFRHVGMVSALGAWRRAVGEQQAGRAARDYVLPIAGGFSLGYIDNMV
jgi:hypothetical protein